MVWKIRWKEIIYCDRVYCLFPAEEAQISFFTIIQGETRRARHGRSEELKAYFFKPEKPINRRRRTSTHPFGKISSMENIPWITRSSWVDGRFLQALGRFRCRGPLLCCFSAERERYKTVWTSSLNSHGSNIAPNRSRADYPEALAKLRKRKKEVVAAMQKVNRTIGADNSTRQCRWQQFQETCCETLSRPVQESLTPSAGRPVASSVKQGPSWDSWWSSSDSQWSGWQDWHSRRELKTFSQFVEFSRISLAVSCDCHTSDGRYRQTPHRGPTCKRKIFSRFAQAVYRDCFCTVLTWVLPKKVPSRASCGCLRVRCRLLLIFHHANSTSLVTHMRTRNIFSRVWLKSSVSSKTLHLLHAMISDAVIVAWPTSSCSSHSRYVLVVPFTWRCTLWSATWSTVWFAEQPLFTDDELHDLMEVRNSEVAPYTLPSEALLVLLRLTNSGEDIAATPVESEINDAQNYVNVGFTLVQSGDRSKCRPSRIYHSDGENSVPGSSFSDQVRRNPSRCVHTQVRGNPLRCFHTKESQVENSIPIRKESMQNNQKFDNSWRYKQIEHFKENRKLCLSSMEQKFIRQFFLKNKEVRYSQRQHSNYFCRRREPSMLLVRYRIWKNQLRSQDSQIFRKKQEYESTRQERNLLRAELQSREMESTSRSSQSCLTGNGRIEESEKWWHGWIFLSGIAG